MTAPASPTIHTSLAELPETKFRVLGAADGKATGQKPSIEQRSSKTAVVLIGTPALRVQTVC
jgi:hypothetical protein